MKNKIKKIIETNLDIVLLPYKDKEGLNFRIEKVINEILNEFKKDIPNENIILPEYQKINEGNIEKKRGRKPKISGE